MTPADPRRVALGLLRRGRDLRMRAFDNAASSAGLEGRDRALAREIIIGVLRHRRTLDALVRPFCRRSRLDEPVVRALRVALYQRLFLKNIPAYAAFHSTLEAAKAELKAASGFVNGVLRAIDRSVEALEDAPAPARDTVCCGGQWYRFDRPVVPDPDTEWIAWCGVSHSFPDSLMQRWCNEVGRETTLARVQALNMRPPLTIRANPLRADGEQVAAALREAGHDCDLHDDQRTLTVDVSGDITQLPGFREGHWAVQDRTSFESAALGAVQPGERVLDLCAAPGGKSFATWELAGGELELYACDTNSTRLEDVQADAERLGHAVKTKSIREDHSDLPEGSWDLILLDVPCSNTGVLDRRPEARWRWKPESFESLLSLQSEIRATAARVADSRTRILWSTCSLETEENKQNAAALADETGLVLVEERRFEPSTMQAGGYAALLAPQS